MERLLIDEDSRREVNGNRSRLRPEEREKFYAAMARSCNMPVPGTGQRLYAISHRHNVGVVGRAVEQTAR